MKSVTAGRLKSLLHDGGEIALLDVREAGQFGGSPLLFATPLPYSRLELDVGALVPRTSARIVVCDDGVLGVAGRAAERLSALGYSDVAVLEGGTAAWAAAGYTLYKGVNVPSKAFGEKVHHDRSVPDLAPEELKELIDGGADLPILDMRTPEEYGRFCIPGGVNVPGGEVIHWAGELRQKPMVIVNCAGRTRSIIGAAGLRRLGLNNVRALKNGTMGWLLAGYQVEKKPTRLGGAKKDPIGAQQLAARNSPEKSLARTPAE